jgi:hypothetical protein
MKVYAQKQIILIKSRHILSLLYEISIPIYAFLPASQNRKHASAVRVRSSSSQPASHGFLNCLVSPVVVTSQLIFQGPEQVVVRGDQIRTVGWMGEQLPAVLLNCLQGQMCSVRPRVVTLKDEFSSYDVFQEAHDEVCSASERSDLQSSSLTIPKGRLRALLSVSYFRAMWCDVIP